MLLSTTCLQKNFLNIFVLLNIVCDPFYLNLKIINHKEISHFQNKNASACKNYVTRTQK